MSSPEALARLLSQHSPEVAGSWYGCAGCQVSFGDSASYAAHQAEVIATEFLVVPRSKAIRWTAKAPGVTLTCYREVPGDAD